MENNGRGIFYGVIGVATLVVAIIGATFAYFSAAGTGNTLGTTGATVGIALTDDVAELKSNLIPVKTSGTEDGATRSNALRFADEANIAGEDGELCVDENNYNICSVYHYNVANPNEGEGAIAQTLYGSITPASFTFFSGLPTSEENIAKDIPAEATHNFNVAIFKGTKVGDVSAALPDENFELTTETADGTLLYRTALEDASVLNVDALTVTLEPKTNMDFTVVMWIEEAGHAQDYDQAKAFTGNITYSTSGGGRLSGTLVG